MITKRISFFLSAALCGALVSTQAQDNAQYDDLYFDGVEPATTVHQQNTTTSQQLEEFDDEVAQTERIQKNTRTYEEYGRAAKPYDYQYASRIRRFHCPAAGFSYYSPYYVDQYWYNPYDRFNYGTSIYISTRWGWTRWNRWNDPWYNRWNDPWYSSSWGNRWNNPWCNRWNTGWGGNSGYNYYALSSPNAGTYVAPQRTRHGSDYVRRSGQHVAQAPSGRNYNANTTNNHRGRSSRLSEDNRSGYSPTRRPIHSSATPSRGNSGRTPNYNNSNSTHSSRGSYSPSRSSSSSRGSYTPSRRSSSNSRSSSGYSPSRSSSSSRGSYTPSRRSSSSSRSSSGYSPSRSSSSSSSSSSRSSSSSSRSSGSSRSSSRGGRR